MSVNDALWSQRSFVHSDCLVRNQKSEMSSRHWQKPACSGCAPFLSAPSPIKLIPRCWESALPIPSLQTDDIDIAQFEDISVAVNDQTRSVLDTLKEVDDTFRAMPTFHGAHVTSYKAKGGLGVEFLTPNKGPDTDKPRRLPALQTDAQPLRFLDILIHEPEQAVVLHGAGVLVLVPSPQRYAVHKLIIYRRRRQDSVKRDKDVQQAEALLCTLEPEATV